MTRPRSGPHEDAPVGGGRWTVARPVVQFAAIGIAAVAIVGLATAAASRRLGQREAITDARTTTLIKAQGVVEPVITDGLARRDPSAVDAVAGAVEQEVIDASLVRVKIWTADGTIVYSNDRRLEGSRFGLGNDELDALRKGLVKADVSDLTQPENRDERSYGKLLEVYLPVRTPSGERLLFEAYYRFDAVAASGARIWRTFAPVSIAALVVLELLQIPLAWSLARRLRQRQREREALLQRGLDASDVERRRIATDLHDGVVQDLAGVAFSLAGAAREADERSPGSAELLRNASEAVRGSITSLRSMLLDIHPPDLGEHGLKAALEDLANDIASDAIHVSVDASQLPDGLPSPVSRLLYRAARESLRNVVRHARASVVTIRAGVDGATAWAEVSDDGAGFDLAVLEQRVADGHLGLKGLEGVVGDAGGVFELQSTPGRGTTVHVKVPVS